MSDPASIPSTLALKRWFGFDLDDTLHEFRKASAQASHSVFEFIRLESGIGIDSLQASYSDILQTTTANAFVDGRTSREYRWERFARLLQVHELNEVQTQEDQENDYIVHLLDIYESSLRSSLKLKAGALALLRALKQRGKKVIVLTEGPTDSQEWTIRELGLEPFVDILVTTNEAGRSKINGLFGVVLERYGIDSHEIAYFGDNAIRDILASQKEGILSVLYDENQETQLVDPDALRINSWESLKDILEREW